MNPSQTAVPLLFDDLLAHLRRLGFSVGVDHHLRLQQLLVHVWGRCAPEELKSLLCPLFATSQKQQEAFYSAFETFLPLLALEAPAIETQAASPVVQGPTKPPHMSKLQAWLPVTCAICLIAILACFAVWKSQIAASRQTVRPTTDVAAPSIPNVAVSTAPAPVEALRPQPPRALPKATWPAIPPIILRMIARFPFDLPVVVVVFGPLLLFLAFEWRRWAERRLVLQRQAGRRPPHTWPIRVEGRASSAFDSPEFVAAARRLNSRQAAESYQLDVAASVRATADALGYPLLRYRADTRLAEYLILIDRESAHDHQAALFAELAHALHDRGLHVRHYFYDSDPRICWSAEDGAPALLTELQNRYREHRLLIFGDADRLTDPVTGRMADWCTTFSFWADRAVLTPVPAVCWSTRERTLAGQFTVLPANTEALSSLVEFFGGFVGREAPRETAQPMVEFSPYLPASELVERLRSELGPQLFCWLCACAVYPELYWDLTLYLASLPSMPPGLVTEENLLRLISLPWFRSGLIPDELRCELIRHLSGQLEREAREAVIRILEKSPADEGTFASETQALEIAVNRYRLSQSSRERRAASKSLQSVSGGSASGDFVALRSLEFAQTTVADFSLPRRLRPIVFRKGLSALGMRTAVRIAIAVIVMAMGLVFVNYSGGPWRRHPMATLRSPVAAVTYIVLKTTPEGAAISVNGSPCGSSTCTMKLAPGHYQAEATLIGYQDTTTLFDVAANSGPREVSLVLQPTPAQIHIATDLTEGTLLVDGAPAGQLEGDATQVPNLSPGEHKLEIQAGNAKASLSITYSASALPKLTKPIKAQGLDAVVISRYGSEAMVYCSTQGVPVTVDGKAKGVASAAGLELRDLAPGPHQVEMTINGLTRKIPFESTTTSGIVASLLTERDVGSLRIVTGEDGVTVYLNGQKCTRQTAGGLLLLSLPPKQYVVHVEKPGLAAAEQQVDVRRGQEALVMFKLLSTKATLEVHGAAPGTEVWLDGAQIGTSNDSGFSAANIEPGKHTIVLQKDRARTTPAEYVFEAGKTTTVDRSKLTATGTLKIEVSPAVEGLQVHLQAEGDSREQAVSGNEVNVPEGTYRVTGSAPQYTEAASSVHVNAGAVTTATLVMKRLEAPVQPKQQAAFSMEDWVKAAAAAPSLTKWERDGPVWVRRGGEFVVAPFNPTPGTVIFTALLLKGKELEWVVNYKDDGNYDLFQIEEGSLVRTEFVNGKRGEPVRKPMSTSAASYVTVMIKLTANSIVHSVLVQRNWVVVDDWARPGGGLQGKLGFYVHGKDQIGVSQFTFTAN